MWGGEFLLADYKVYQRVAQLKYIPLPGGDAATRKPARIALAHLWVSNIDWDPDDPPVAALCAEERSIIRSQLELKINTPLTSSMGRLFDAVSALVGVCQVVNYEAQAAIELEALADIGEAGVYDFWIEKSTQPGRAKYQINPAPIIKSVIEDMHRNVPQAKISARFHNSIASLVRQVCNMLREEHGVNTVALSGGVWQNMTLLHKAVDLLKGDHFQILVHRQVPANDGGMALGQAVIVAHRMTG
jgi:hydrogenase maturation protein HypF